MAMGLAAIVGLERELAREQAGLRTHMLIGGSAALIVSLGKLMAADFSDEHFGELIHVDPVRLVEAIVAAVGFVGAGTILKRREGEEVRGLTTAASLLMVAGLGIAVALSHFVLAVGATVLCLAVLWLLRIWEERVLER
jgi:putative Mg2+ transporter-C (MgtC) family protein